MLTASLQNPNNHASIRKELIRNTNLRLCYRHLACSNSFMIASHSRVLLACSTVAAVLAATAWATTATADIPSGSGDSASSASPSPSTTASPSDSASPTASGSASGSATSSASATSSGSASASASATGELDYIVTVREGAQAAVASAVEASGGEVAVTYDKAINGLAVSMTPAEALVMRARADVTAIERDLPVSIGAAYDDSGSGPIVTDSGCSANSMSRNDDYGTDSIDVSAVTTANWYGSAYSRIFINTNGGFSWDDGLGGWCFSSGFGVGIFGVGRWSEFGFDDL